LSVARRGGDCAAPKGTGGRATVSNLGLPGCADRVDVAGRTVDRRSCFSRAGDFGNRRFDRAQRCPGLFLVAQSGARLAQPLRVRAAKQFCHASEIKETTNGGRRGARGQARRAFGRVASRSIERHVQIDEPKRTAQSSQEQAQESAAQTETQITTKAVCGERNCTGWKKPGR